jgi:hypothetical protein
LSGLVSWPFPPRAQRFALSLLVVIHFGGIAAFIFANPAPSAFPSWLASQLHARIHKPYLEFMFLEANYALYSQGDRPSVELIEVEE